jgi:hypothetical protein
MTGRRALALGLLIALPALAGSGARAQDFATPAALPWAGPTSSRAFPVSPADMIERGLPPPVGAAAVELGAIRWQGLAELTTRSAAASAGWRSLRVAAGFSQTGEPDVGWSALGVAVGIAEASGGAALRGEVRRDRTTSFGFDAHGAAVGAEVGGGAWVAAAPDLCVWASAPQLWTRGEAPPLERSLEIGAAARFGAIGAWLTRAAVPGSPTGARGEHAAGFGTAGGALAMALTVRDQPLRGGLVVAATARGIRVAAAVEGHPVLGETVRLSLGLGGGR